jgi:subtilisin-like proprotein convertase family protein
MKRALLGITGLAALALLAVPASAGADTATLSQNEGGNGIQFAAADPTFHPADVYPSTITGPAGTVNDINVSVQVAHTTLDDLDVGLVSPNGTWVHLFSDACGTDAGIHNLKFDDAAAGFLSDAGPCDQTPFYKPSNYNFMGEADIYSPPAPATTTLNALSFFNGGPSGGAWRLFGMDDLTGSGGSIGVWSITFDFTPTPAVTPTPTPTPVPTPAPSKCKKKKKGKRSAASAACKKKKKK